MDSARLLVLGEYGDVGMDRRHVFRISPKLVWACRIYVQDGEEFNLPVSTWRRVDVLEQAYEATGRTDDSMTPEEMQNTAVAAGSAIGIVAAIIITVKRWGAQIASALGGGSGGGKDDDGSAEVVDAIEKLTDHIDKSNETTKVGFRDLQKELSGFKEEVHRDMGKLRTDIAVGKQRLDTLEQQVRGGK